MKIKNLLLSLAVPEDGADFYQLLIKLDYETDYTPFQFNERSSDINRYISFIEQTNKNGVLVFAIDPEITVSKIVGFVIARRDTTIKKHHVAKIGMGILKQYQLSGIGRSLLRDCINKSLSLGVRRLEAYIPVSNIKSKNLINKFNFKLEGTKKNQY